MQVNWFLSKVLIYIYIYIYIYVLAEKERVRILGFVSLLGFRVLIE